MKNKSKIITYILAGILLFLIVFLYMQIQYDKKKTELPTNNISLEEDIEETTEIEPIITENILNNNKNNKTEDITEIENIISEDNNSFNIISNKTYSLEDKISINELSENAEYDTNASTILIKSGNLQTYNITINNYEFNIDNYTLDFDIEMYATTLNSEFILDTNNFKVYYGDELLENLTINEYIIGKNPTNIKLSFRFDENIPIKEINTTFFKFIYTDEFNIRNINIY